MRIFRNAAITSAALMLGFGAVAHASGSGHSDDNRAGYYGQSSSRHSGTDDNRAGYYGQPNTTSAPAAATKAKGVHKQVLAKEVKSTYLFGPKEVKIKVGTTITWSNRSDAEHNVTFDKNSKVNMDFKPNKSVSYTFTKAGTFTYHCEYHPYMKGTVIVLP
jgi:plastocyanin